MVGWIVFSKTTGITGLPELNCRLYVIYLPMVIVLFQYTI